MANRLRLDDYRPGRQEERWRRQDEDLESYCHTPWLRSRGNLHDGNHRTRLPTLGEQERGGNVWDD